MRCLAKMGDIFSLASFPQERVRSSPGDRTAHKPTAISSARKTIRSGSVGKKENPEVVLSGSSIADNLALRHHTEDSAKIVRSSGLSRAVEQTVLEDQPTFGTTSVIRRRPKIMQQDERPSAS